MSSSESLSSDGFPQKTYRPILWITALVLAVFVMWAANAPLEESTRGIGKIEPSSRVQVIQSYEGGILEALTVEEGEEVSKGQTLAILEDTSFRAAYQDFEGQTIALRAAIARLKAELDRQSTFEVDDEVAKDKSIVEIERNLFQARQRRFAEGIASLDERIALAKKELNLIKPLVERGAASTVDMIRLERAVADLQGERTEQENSYFQDIADQIAQKSAELSSLRQRLAQKGDALRRSTLVSPVRGIVKNMEVTTQGGVIKPGETIMEIVPLDEQLYVEAQIEPRDVAFLHPGLPATVKVTAYDFAVYGSLDGHLTFISADTIQDETRRDSEPYYRVRVLTDSAYLNGPDGPLPIKPGMIAEVSIQTGEKTVLDYLLKPILRGQEALTER